MRRALLFLKSMHPGWIHSRNSPSQRAGQEFVPVPEVGLLLSEYIMFPLEDKHYVLHYLIIVRRLLHKLCIAGELHTSVPTGGPKFDIVELRRWCSSCSMLTSLTNLPTQLPFSELQDCWELLGLNEERWRRRPLPYRLVLLRNKTICPQTGQLSGILEKTIEWDPRDSGSQHYH